jgi:16S rRNA A1518/A1519 N6-dimethyltransferase RsmA/KsgA/DIM1 with predicted DNA glycosylase/AP lyase activity
MNSLRRRRALGQHYLVDSSVVDLIIEASAIQEDERVLEIGTGKGVLTKRLCGLSLRVEAFELDDTNYLATKRLAGKGVDLHLGDAFSAKPSFDVLVSSLPYSESSNFVEWLCQTSYSRAIVILQKEFVEKLMMRPHESMYRAISVIFQMSSSIEVLRDIGPDSFSPPPRVSSAVVRIEPKVTLRPRQISIVKMLFSQKKRKMGTALKHLGFGDGGLPLEKLSRRVWDFSAVEVSDLIKDLH